MFQMGWMAIDCGENGVVSLDRLMLARARGRDAELVSFDSELQASTTLAPQVRLESIDGVLKTPEYIDASWSISALLEYTTLCNGVLLDNCTVYTN